MRTVSWIATTAVGLVVAGALVAPQALRWLEASAAAPAEGAVAGTAHRRGHGGAPVAGPRRPSPARHDRGPRPRPTSGSASAASCSARRVSVGDTVKAGDVVATLDETDLRLQLEAAEAEQAAARIALEKAEINLAPRQRP